ncbi:MAG: DNA cytosine methyltransferase [Lysobacteraceae bacterium]
MKERSIKVVDIFAGPGGLGEGFSAFNVGGVHPFHTVVSAEKDPVAASTLRLRAFFRALGGAKDAPDAYYDFLRGDRSLEDLAQAFPLEWDKACKEALKLELGPESQRLHALIAQRVGKRQPWVLIGGPPCQAYSLAGRSRNKGKKGYVPEQDTRHFLYREYLQILAEFQPTVFIMENVKGILTSKVEGQLIFRQILEDLHSPGTSSSSSGPSVKYDIFPIMEGEGGAFPGEDEGIYEHFVARSEVVGVPQARHRVILVGVKRGEGSKCHRRLAIKETIPVDAVIKDLPRLRSGVTRGQDSEERWLDVLDDQRASVRRSFGGSHRWNDIADYMRGIEFDPGRGRSSAAKPDARARNPLAHWFYDRRLGVTLNHRTRSHMPEDLGRYLFCSVFAHLRGRSPLSQDFPERLAPNHRSWESGSFANRFRVQLARHPSTTIVSHISKDGHYFIHHDPTQCRSFTVREAARAQTFPDNYLFMGGQTDQYVQVGNAVPPLLAVQIAEIVWSCLD